MVDISVFDFYHMTLLFSQQVKGKVILKPFQKDVEGDNLGKVYQFNEAPLIYMFENQYPLPPPLYLHIF